MRQLGGKRYFSICASMGAASWLLGQESENTNTGRSDLVLNGYSDWYLPSKEELNKLYINRVAVGGFASSNYVTSSEFDNANAGYQVLLQFF